MGCDHSALGSHSQPRDPLVSADCEDPRWHQELRIACPGGVGAPLAGADEAARQAADKAGAQGTARHASFSV